MLHAVDAASAALVAATEDVPPGVYNVTDGVPAPSRAWIQRLAEVLGAPPPRRVPRWLARLFAGPAAVYSMCDHPPVDSSRFRELAGWTPSVEDWRVGFGTMRNR